MTGRKRELISETSSRKLQPVAELLGIEERRSSPEPKPVEFDGFCSPCILAMNTELSN